MNDLADNLQEGLLQSAWVLAKVVVIVLAAFALDGATRSRVADALARRAIGRNGTLVIGRFVSTMIYVGALLAILGAFGASWTGLLTFMGASAVTLGLSLQDVLKNFFSGVFLLMERPFRPGDQIRVRDVEGEVQGIDVRTTLVRIADGSLVMIPNSLVFTEVLTNRSQTGKRRVSLLVSAAGSSIPDLTRIVHEVVGRFPQVARPIPAPVIRDVSAGEVKLELSLVIDDADDVVRDVMHALVSAAGNASISVTRT